MRGKGEGAVYRVPADKTKPLQYWTAVIELPPGPNGERRRKPIRRKNKAEVVRLLSEMRSDLERRGDLPTANQTTETWFRYWLDKVAAKTVRPNTLEGYRASVDKHIIPAIGKVKLDKLSAAHIRRVHDSITGKGLSSTTALLSHRVMSKSFKVAVQEGRIGRNPAALIDAPRKATPQLEALDLDECLHLLDYLSTHPQGALWATVLLTGARRGEVIGLERSRVGDVLDLSWQLLRIKKTDNDGRPDVPADYEYRHITGGLYWTRPKATKSWRIVPLAGPLKIILERHLETTPTNQWDLLFTRTDKQTGETIPLDPAWASREWRKILAAAGITKDVRLHDGRHTTVDLLYAAGVPEDLISEIVGHSTRTMTQSYKSLRNRQRLTGAMEQFSALLASRRSGSLELEE